MLSAWYISWTDYGSDLQWPGKCLLWTAIISESDANILNWMFIVKQKKNSWFSAQLPEVEIWFDTQVECH